MNDIIQNLEANATNGEENFCYISEKQLNAMKELSKGEAKENKQLKDNWDKLKEYISIKLYNTEYLQKLCGCGIDDFDHMLLDAIREEMQKLEKGEK